MHKRGVTAETVLVADDDVIVRLDIAAYLRAHDRTVIEAANADEAKLVLQRGPRIDVLLAEAELAGGEGGFGLARWVRRYRSHVAIVLMGGLVNKTELTVQLCEGSPAEATRLLQRIQSRRRRNAGAVVRRRVLRRG